MNAVQLNQYQIVFTNFLLIWHQTKVGLVPKQSENCKYKLIWVYLNKIQNKLLCVYQNKLFSGPEFSYVQKLPFIMKSTNAKTEANALIIF